ncbi:MAG: catalase [Moraxellaceae bacterium]|nr:catalase [Moraxellaceae bacterium]
MNTRTAHPHPGTPGADRTGNGGELHRQHGGGKETLLTTNQGIPVADNQNSLRVGSRGPTLLEDFILREKITHFDHERIPERIVHARGSGAHGYFQVYRSLSGITRAKFLQDPSVKTPVFVRFSTVAGGSSSIDLARDVRGFAVKFYTEEGNFDLVGNNIPVFFIQDAMKFPDLVHSVKQEPDRGFPQAASAHDTFWDFISLMPEAMHMIMWAMSDRTIPRSYRMMEGFGVHTFRLVNEFGESRFVKFHWRPVIGAESVLWDEAVKINGADPDYHRRDLWEAIENGQYPEYELGLQVFDQETADRLAFDVLDPTKLIPEEEVPLEIVGKLVLDRNPDNFFAETEQVAFCPANIVPGIDFSDDPLLQGRLFSYLDTQLSRLGGPNFHQLPVNKPRCPMHNFTRDGMAQMEVPKGRVSYEPNSLAADAPRECPVHGFTSFPAPLEGNKTRLRAESFSDHYSQARQFLLSMTPPEREHIANALAFELGKVETIAIRTRMLGHLKIIDAALEADVADQLGMTGKADVIEPAQPPKDLQPSPALSLLAKARNTLEGRKLAVLLGDGFDPDMLVALESRLKKDKAQLARVALKPAAVQDSTGKVHTADMALAGAPSVLFHAVVVLANESVSDALADLPVAQQWLRDAFGHYKAIGIAGCDALAGNAAVKGEFGVIDLKSPSELDDFLLAARSGRVWDRVGF